MQNQVEEVEVQTTTIGDAVFRITANKIPSAAVPGAFSANAEFFYINSQRVEKNDFDHAFAQARSADDAAKANQ